MVIRITVILSMSLAEDKQQIRYELAKERCASEFKKRKNQAVIKED